MAWPADMHSALHRTSSPQCAECSPSGLMPATTLMIACLALAANVFGRVDSYTSTDPAPRQNAVSLAVASAEPQPPESPKPDPPGELSASVPAPEISLNAFVRTNIVPVQASESGRVAAINVEAGQHVAPGEVLATFDDKLVRESMRQAEHEWMQNTKELEIEKALIELEQKRLAAIIDKLSATLRGCDAEIEVATLGAQRSEKERERLLNFKPTHPALQREKERLAARYAPADANLTKAKARRAEIESELKIARIDLAGLNVREMKQEQIELRIADAEARIEQAKSVLKQLVVRSSQEGRVAEVHGRAGQYLYEGQALLTLQPEGGAWLEAWADETVSEELHVGDEVDVALDTQPSTNFVAQITAVEDHADFGLSAEQTRLLHMLSGPHTPRCAVRISLPADKDNIPPGMSATVRVRRPSVAGAVSEHRYVQRLDTSKQAISRPSLK